MEAVLKPTKRRTLLQRGLAVVGGALGLRAMEGKAEAGPPPASPITAPGAAFKLYGRRRTVPPPGRGAAPGMGHQVRYGELLDCPDGEVTGTFCSNGFCLETPFGPPVRAASNIEFQTFTLPDGTLFGIGAAPAGPHESVHAILGGTGRFAGVRGSYVERPTASGTASPGVVEFVVTLTA
jgi:hypothetical protein